MFVETAQAMGVENLLDLDLEFTPTTNTNLNNNSQGMDLLSMEFGNTQIDTEDDMEMYLESDQSQGLEILGKFTQLIFLIGQTIWY